MKLRRQHRGKEPTQFCWICGVLLLLLFPSTLFLAPLQAQQEPMYSQYMFNGLILNPAYTGSREQISMSLIGRRQWTGIEGAPSTESFGIHTPFRGGHGGIGLTLVHDKIGWTEDIDMNFTYAYRIPIKDKYHLALGLLGGVKYHQVAFSQISTHDPNDPVFTGQDLQVWKPNFGTGIYFHSDRFYIGGSAPNLLANRQAKQLPDGSDEGVPTNHYYLSSGIVLDVVEGVKIKPSLLIKGVRGSPVGLDLNLSWLFVDRFWVGTSYRLKDAWVIMAEVQLTQQIRVGYSFDRTLSPLVDFTNGSHEFRLGIDMKINKNKIESPRLFYF